MQNKYHEVIIADEAELDLLEAFAWYEEQQEELGEKFMDEVEMSFRKIAINPTYNHFIGKEVRAFCMNRYPYNILYIVEANVIKIIAVFHTSRNPTIWKLR